MEKILRCRSNEVQKIYGLLKFRTYRNVIRRRIQSWENRKLVVRSEVEIWNWQCPTFIWFQSWSEIWSWSEFQREKVLKWAEFLKQEGSEADRFRCCKIWRWHKEFRSCQYSEVRLLFSVLFSYFKLTSMKGRGGMMLELKEEAIRVSWEVKSMVFMGRVCLFVLLRVR